jgi:hypothetical protein
VFASGDSAPVKVAADWSEAEQRFATVRGLGARTRASQAFEVSGRIIADGSTVTCQKPHGVS